MGWAAVVGWDLAVVEWAMAAAEETGWEAAVGSGSEAVVD